MKQSISVWDELVVIDIYRRSKTGVGRNRQIYGRAFQRRSFDSFRRSGSMAGGGEDKG